MYEFPWYEIGYVAGVVLLGVFLLAILAVFVGVCANLVFYSWFSSKQKYEKITEENNA